MYLCKSALVTKALLPFVLSFILLMHGYAEDFNVFQ